METNLVFLGIAYIISIILYRKYKDKFNNLSKISLVLIGLFITIIILIVPFISEENEFKKIVLAILYSIQCIYVGQDISLIRNSVLTENLSSTYIFFLYFCFLLAPILTTGFVLSLLENVFQKVYLTFNFISPFLKEIYVFSNLNKDSVMLAEKIKTKSNLIIFCNVKDEVIKESLKSRCKKINAVLVKESELDIKITKKKINFVEISSDEIYNTDQSLKLVEKYENEENVKVVDFSTRTEAELMLDSVERNIEVELINKNKYSIYNLLNERPPIKYAIDKKVSILLAGTEEKVLILIKAFLWSMQIVGYTIKINVVGSNANHIRDRFYHDCPGLKEERYDVHFYEVDIQTEQFDELIKEKFQDTTYIVLANDSDDINIKVGVFLREYFLYLDKKSYTNSPPIHLWLNEDIKGLELLGINESLYTVSTVKNRKLQYDLYAFGTAEQIYKEISILNNKFPKFALYCHLANMDRLFSPPDKQKPHITNFKNREKTRDYSMGAVIHLKNSLFAHGVDIYYDIDDDKIKKVNKLLKNKKIHKEFEDSDLKYWNVHARARGFRFVTFEEAKVYKENGTSRNQQHPLAKLNPCLVEPEEFQKAEDDLEKFMGRKINLIQVEKDYVDSIPTILEYVLKNKLEL